MQDISNFVTWPIVVLIGIVLSVFGLLNSPFRALGESFGGLIKELRQLKNDLPQIEQRVNSATAAINGLADQVEAKVSDVANRLNDTFNGRLDDMEETLKKRINDLDTPESDVSLAEKLASSNSGPHYLGESAGDGIEKIKAEWWPVVDMILEIDPDADRRSIGTLASDLAKGRNSRISKDDAILVADLHSRFKSYTRRQQYADEWLTREQVESFVRDAKHVRGDRSA